MTLAEAFVLVHKATSEAFQEERGISCDEDPFALRRCYWHGESMGIDKPSSWCASFYEGTEFLSTAYAETPEAAIEAAFNGIKDWTQVH